jgi:hypothetical protein
MGVGGVKEPGLVKSFQSPTQQAAKKPTSLQTGFIIIIILLKLPSGKLAYMEHHHFQWVNPLFLWQFSIAFWMFTRG